MMSAREHLRETTVLASAAERKPQEVRSWGVMKEMNEMLDSLLPKADASRKAPANALVMREGRMVLTPDDARRVLREMNYPRQRRIYQHHVALLADYMRRKQWTRGTQIAFGRLGSKLYLVNGQHRLAAVSEAGLPQEFQVVILEANTEEELHTLYHRFDVGARTRSVPEILNATNAAEGHGVSKTMAKVVYDCAGFINAGFSRPNYQQDPVAAQSVDARLEAAETWWEIAREFEAIINQGDEAIRRNLRQAGVAAVAFVTLKHAHDKASGFWLGTAKDDGLHQGDPRKTLLKALTERDLRAGGVYTRSLIPATAWNSWFRGKQVKTLKWYEGSVVPILGTPYAIGAKK